MNSLLQGILCVLSIGIFGEVFSMDPVKHQCKIPVKHLVRTSLSIQYNIFVKPVRKELGKKKMVTVKKAEDEKAIIVQNSSSTDLYRSGSASVLDNDAFMNYKDIENEVSLGHAPYPLHRLVCQENATVDQVKDLIKQGALTNKQIAAAYHVTRRYGGESPVENWENSHCGNPEVVNYLFNKILTQKLKIVIYNRQMAEDYEKAKLKAQELSNDTKKRKTDTFVLDL